MVGEWEFSEVMFTIQLQPDSTGWTASQEMHVSFSFGSPWSAQEPLVAEMVAAINTALRERKELDLTERMKAWAEVDPEFGVLVKPDDEDAWNARVSARLHREIGSGKTQAQD
jgi:hypothetical protein